MNMKRVGIKEVAKEAGVSITTVSRALNGYSDVSEKTKERIMEVVNRLNYVPDINARSLGGKKEITIALLLSGLTDKDESGLTFGVLSGTYHSTIKNQCEFILLTTNASKQREMNYLQLCRQKNIDGVVIQGIRMDDPYYKELIKSEIPCVVIDINLTGDKVCSVSIDNVEAAYVAVKYLLNNGHKNIAIINGREAAEVSRDRFAGYAKALIEESVMLNLNYMRYCDFDEEIAYNKTLELLTKNPEITAIFCISDVMALGTIRAINSLGKSVPEDISVIGFDDMPMAKYINGGLTTIRQNPFTIGQVAGDILFNMIYNKPFEYHITIPYEFLERNTVKNIRD